MEITLIGLGYVGLPVACALAQKGVIVYGIDKNEKLINNLKTKNYDYTEPKLNDILSLVLDKNLFVSKNIVPADTYIITVQTPVDENHKADNSYVETAMLEVSSILKDGDLVILESTVPVGSNEGFIEILKNNSKAKFNYCYCPESILPGNIFYEIENNSRTIGGINKESAEKAKTVYDIINISSKSITGIKEAEFVKLVQNAHRDVEIAFVNELSIMCEQEGVDPFEVIEIARKHPRCLLLNPGSGVGGHCLAVDPYFLVERYGDDASVIAAARAANNYKPIYVADKALKTINFDKDKVIGVLGLSYKPNCDDCRKSSGIAIVKYLQSKGYKVLANEVNSREKILNGIINTSLKDVVANSDCIIIAQKHSAYSSIDLSNKTVINPVNL